MFLLDSYTVFIGFSYALDACQSIVTQIAQANPIDFKDKEGGDMAVQRHGGKGGKHRQGGFGKRGGKGGKFHSRGLMQFENVDYHPFNVEGSYSHLESDGEASRKSAQTQRLSGSADSDSQGVS